MPERALPVCLDTLPDRVLDTLLQHLSLTSLHIIRTTCRSLCKLIDSRKLHTMMLCEAKDEHLRYMLPPFSATASWAALRKRRYSHITRLHVCFNPNAVTTAYLLAAASSMHNLQVLHIDGSMSLAALAVTGISGRIMSNSTSDGNQDSSSRSSSGAHMTGVTATALHTVLVRRLLPCTKVELSGQNASNANALVRLCARFTALQRLHLRHDQRRGDHQVVEPLRITTPLCMWASTLVSLQADVSPACLAVLTSLRTLRLDALRAGDLIDDAYISLSCLTNLRSLSLPAKAIAEFDDEDDPRLSYVDRLYSFHNLRNELGQLFDHLPTTMTSLHAPNDMSTHPVLTKPIEHLTRLTRLQRLVLGSGNWMSVTTLAMLPSLTCLLVTGLHNFRAHSIHPLPASQLCSLSSLQHLELSDVEDLGYGLAQLYTSLTALIMHGSGSGVSLASARNMWNSDAFVGLSKLALPTLLLPHVGSTCTTVTDLLITCCDEKQHDGEDLVETVRPVLAEVCGLTRLRFESSDKIRIGTSEAVRGLVASHAPSVTHLELAMLVSTAGLVSLTLCEQLTHLMLEDFKDSGPQPPPMATFLAAVLVLAAMPRLRNLHFGGCTGMTEAVCSEVVMACGRQEQLCIEWLDNARSSGWTAEGADEQEDNAELGC